MSVKFKIYQDVRTKSKTKGKFYARAVVSDVADLESISLRRLRKTPLPSRRMSMQFCVNSST